MKRNKINSEKYHNKFLNSKRKHILLITNHGIHSWKVTPGLPDTGGQNNYVNQLSDCLYRLGYKITIVNRGGYSFNKDNSRREGLDYKNPYLRIFYLEDNIKVFIRKEDMFNQIGELSNNLFTFLKSENSRIHMIISNYWDGGALGVRIKNNLKSKTIHLWIPHSLGEIKKKNVSRDDWVKLRIKERIETEKEIVKEVDFIIATSTLVRNSLKESYKLERRILSLPPCIDPNRFYPKKIKKDNYIWDFLENLSGLSKEELHKSQIITEISRTDTTKRKDILIKAFAKIVSKGKKVFLIIAIDKNSPLGKELIDLIHNLGIESRVAVVGSIYKELPTVYQISDIYCSPSIMEGFGMSVQEAAASKVAVVSSNLVPFTKNYLLGKSPRKLKYDDVKSILIGKGGIIVPENDIEGYIYALNFLLRNKKTLNKIAKKAYNITIPHFLWYNMVKKLLSKINRI